MILSRAASTMSNRPRKAAGERRTAVEPGVQTVARPPEPRFARSGTCKLSFVRNQEISYVSGEYGFIAMQFNDPTLDPFVEEVIKPTVKAGTGYDLVHMRDVGRAGVIDNIMRTQIKQAEFVIADLTHDNSGAYWEAGYAEGLGKPVVYICEQEKFEERKTHFDTNHCTTVMWSKSEDSNFEEELVSTLRRSLNKPPLT